MNIILIIEDEIPIALEIQKIVQQMGYFVIHVTTLTDALHTLSSEPIDCVISDINLEGEFEGIDLAKEIELNFPNLPLIFITSYIDPIILENIATIKYESYIVKPFKRHDIEAALKIISYKEGINPTGPIRLTRNYVFDSSKALLIYNNEEIQLSRLEIRLFNCLIEHGLENIVSFDTIDDKVWGNPVSDTVRRNLIYRLNKRLPEKIISAKSGIGYLLITL